MHTFFKCKIFCGSKSTARSYNTFNRRSICQRLEHYNIRKYTRFFKRINEEFSDVIFNTHAGKNHNEFFIAIQKFCLSNNLSSQFVMWQPVSRENRKLLSTNKGVHSINCRDSSLNKISWIDSGIRINRLSVYIYFLRRNNFRISVNWFSQSIKYPSQKTFTNTKFQWLI